MHVLPTFLRISCFQQPTGPSSRYRRYFWVALEVPAISTGIGTTRSPRKPVPTPESWSGSSRSWEPSQGLDRGGFPLAADRPPFTGLGDDAGLVARRIPSADETAGPRLVSPPARYTLLTSLGLALLAGRGLDHTVAPRRFWTGLILAILVGAGTRAWSIYWAKGAGFQSNVLAETAWIRFGTAGLFWIGGLAAIVAWHRHRVGARHPFH